MNLFAALLFAVGAIFAFLLGIFFLFLPKHLAKINEWTNRTILKTEDILFKYRIVVGLLLLIFGIFLIYMIYSKPLKL